MKEKLAVRDMTILDHEHLECVHDPPLHRDHLHRVSVHILSDVGLGSDTHCHTICCSVLFHASRNTRT